MPKSKNRLLVGIVAVVAAFALAGCNPKPNNATNNPDSQTPPTSSDNGSNNGSTTDNSNTGSSNTDNNAANNKPKDANWPSDAPTLSGAYDFGYAKLGGSYYLTYKIPYNSDISKVRTNVLDLMKSAGWQVKEEQSIQVNNAVLESLTKGDSTMTLTASNGEGNQGYTDIAITIAPNSK